MAAVGLEHGGGYSRHNNWMKKKAAGTTSCQVAEQKMRQSNGRANAGRKMAT